MAKHDKPGGEDAPQGDGRWDKPIPQNPPKQPPPQPRPDKR